MNDIVDVKIPDLAVNDNRQSNANFNFNVVNVSLGDTSNYEGAISQGEEPNVLNRFVGWIRSNVLHIPTNGKQLDLAEIIRLKSLEENKPESEIEQQISEEFPSAIPQYYIHSALSSFFNTATAGIIPEDTKLTPETTTGKILQPLATGAMDLAGFITFALMTGGVGNIAKVAKSGNYIERIGNLLKSVPIASKLAETYPFANIVKNALIQGFKFGGLTLADSLINMNEHTNDVWMAIKDLTPEALDNFIIGAGLPLAGKISSPFKRVLLALTLGNVASKITTGTTDITKLLNGIRMADPEAMTNAVFNLGVQAFFGLASVEPRPEKEIKETQDFLGDLYNNVKLQMESQKLESFDLYTEPKNIDISFDKLLKQQQKANIQTIAETEEIPTEKIKQVDETESYTDEKTDNEIKQEERQGEIPETAGDFIDNPTYQFKDITNKVTVYGVMKGDKASKKLVMEPFNDYNDLRLWSMQGTKQTIGSLEQYHRLLSLGLKNVDAVYDAFMGSGFITNLLHNTKSLKDLVAGKKYYINEINRYRNTFAQMLYNDNPDELIKYVKKAYDDIVNRFDSVVKNNKGKTSEEIAKISARDLSDYLNDLLDPSNNKLTDKEKAGYYYFAQNLTYMSIPIDKVKENSKDFTVRYDKDRIVNLFNIKNYLNDKNTIINDKWQEIENKLKNMQVPKDTHVYYGADTWSDIDKLPKNSFVIWDSEYVDTGKGGVTEYKGNLLIKPVTSHTSVESYIEALDKLIPEINKKNAKIILHNNWRDDLADELSDRGFLVSKTFRGSGKNAKAELLAYNFDVDGNRLEVGKGIDNTKYLFSAGLSPEMIKFALQGTTRLGRKIMKLIADDVDGYRATVFHMLLTPEFSQYSKNPIVRETFKDLQRNIFEAQKYIANLTDDMKQKLETSALSLKSIDKSVAEKINEVLVKGDAEKKNPLELIDEYDLSEKDRKVAKEVIKNIGDFFDKAWDIKAKHYKQLIEKLQNSKIKSYANEVLENIYEVKNEYPYYIPRTRNVGNIKIDVYDTETDKKVHSEIVLDYSPLFAGGKSILAKIVADKLRKQYSDSKYDITISSVKNFDIKKDADLYGILDYLGEVLDNVDLQDGQKEQIFGELVNYIKSTGFTAHLIKRAKNVIKGYNEDVIGVTHSYFNAFKASLLKSQLKETFANALELAKQDNVVYKMVRNVFDEYMRNRDSLDKGIAMVKGFAFMKYLGFSMRQLIIQSTQTPIFTGMHLAVEEAKGKKATALDWVKSEANLIKSSKEYLTGEYKNDPVKTKFINDLEKTGVLNAQQTAFYTGKTSLLSDTWNKFTSAAGYIMAVTERFNRYVSALSYINTHYDQLKSSLKENYADELYNIRSFVYLTNGKYGDTELPLFLQGADTVKRVARLGMIFQTFQIDMLQGMKKLMSEGQYTALLMGLGSMCFLGGLTALPFYNAIKSAYLNTTGRDMETDMVKFMGSDKFVDWMQSGLFGKAGIDISSSLGLQTPLDMAPYMSDNVADQFATVVFGVSYASLKDTIKSIKYLGGGDLDKALYYGLPFRFLAYPIKAVDQYYRGITTSGDLLLVDPLTGKPLKLTLKEALLQSVGFTPQRISEFMNIYYNYKALSQYYQNKRKSLYMKYRNAVERGNWKLGREILMQGIKLNKKVSIINADYGTSLPLFNLRSIGTISKQVDLMRFMRYNYNK